MKSKYFPVISGYEHILSITGDDIELHENDLDIALFDYNACRGCRGVCGTFHKLTISGMPTYYDLNPKAMRMYKHLAFAIFTCPGPGQRNEMIKKRLETDRDDEFFVIPVTDNPFEKEEVPV
jgi:hypothetical protein